MQFNEFYLCFVCHILQIERMSVRCASTLLLLLLLILRITIVEAILPDGPVKLTISGVPSLHFIHRRTLRFHLAITLTASLAVIIRVERTSLRSAFMCRRCVFFPLFKEFLRRSRRLVSSQIDFFSILTLWPSTAASITHFSFFCSSLITLSLLVFFTKDYLFNCFFLSSISNR